MYEIVTCPHCKRRLQLPVEHLGAQVQCPNCETTFTAGTAPPAPPVMQEPAQANPDAITTPDMTIPPAPKTADASEPAPKSIGRRRRTFDPGKVKPKPASSPLRIILAVGAVAGVLLVAGVCWVASNHDGVAKKFAVNVDKFAADPDPLLAEVPDRLLTAEEQKQHADAFFQFFSGVMRNNQQEREKGCIDFQHMLDKMFEQQILPAAWRADSGQLHIQMRQKLTTVNLHHPDNWRDFQVKHVRHPQARELVVLTRHPHNMGGAFRFRWWLHHDGGRWVIRDMEDIDYGTRLSVMMALDLNSRFGPPLANDLHALRNGANAILRRVNFDDADRQLTPVNADKLAKPCAAMHHMLLCSIRVRQKRFDEAIKFGEPVARLQPDEPVNDVLLAISYNSTGRSDLALKHAEQARALIGAETDVSFEIGLALHSQNRPTDAADNYRKVLDFEPEHQDAFFNLIRCMGRGADNKDIGERFLRLKDPRLRFEQYAQDRWQVRDHATLELLVNAMKQREPRYAEAEFYRSLTLGEQGRAQPALAAFKEALQLQGDDIRRTHYVTEFCRTMVLRDQILETYAQMPDAALAFRSLAGALKDFHRPDELKQLIDVHAKKHPKDSYLQAYLGAYYLQRDQFKEADAAFTRAFGQIQDLALRDRFRIDCVRARYQTGDVLGAYRDFSPQRMTFQQLAELCWQDKKGAELDKLLEAHAQNDAIDPQLERTRWRIDLLHKRYDAAGQRLRAVVKAQPVNDPNDFNNPNRFVLQNFLHDAVDAGAALEGYRQAPDASAALESVARDLGEMNQTKELDAVLDEHRKKFPNDPVLSMYLGQRAFNKREWAKAADAFKAGWGQLPEAKRLSWSYPYLQARVKLGQPVEAYRETGHRPAQFRQLATMLLADKQTDLFEDLLRAHRPQRQNDPDFAAYEARLKILRGKPADAADLLLKFLKDKNVIDSRRIATSFLSDLAAYDVAAEAYRCIPDKSEAFGQMAWRYRTPERSKEYDRLILEHTKHQPNDPRLITERAELHMVRNEYAQAEKLFAQVKDKEPLLAGNTSRFGFIRARIKLAKAAQTYRELGANPQTFLDVANQCIAQKEPGQLEETIAAHRLAFPAAKNLAGFEVDLRWLKKDYQGTVDFIKANDGAMLKNNTNRWKCEGYLIRSLVRLKKSEEAVKEAEKLNERKFGPLVLLVLALSSTGDAKRTIAFIESKSHDRYFVEDCYYHEDLGPILRGKEYAALHERYPPPPLQRTPGQIPFDDWD